MIKWLGNHGSVGAARRAARQDREQDETAAGKTGGLLVHRESFRMPDAVHLPLNMKPGGR